MDLRQTILDTKDLPVEAVEVPEWNMTVYVRSMTGYERDVYEGDLLDKRDAPIKERMKNLRSSLVVLCTVDENGERIFKDEDKEAVGKKSARALNRILSAAQHLNALTEDDLEEEAGN